ncbi:serine/arginine repetitive matrix protein 2 isoform X2 [Plodia interpunctella]|uniref:serine/arginine repetitive matrix protein 2 isoform X2 n=1 Tax=Plodia interpunctella TaxID=58824 RepID=UPI00236799B5|nr:serine/arginine repetitive matrix protein 2 isoform X2 [Plodia interpunctella]
MVVGENKRTNIMDGIENTGDVRLHDHRLRLKQRFDIVRKLGQGTYGKVQLGINKKTGQEVAIKTIKKCKIESEADLIRIRREVQIMSSVRHPNIVHIYEVFENSEKMILVMEYCSGGELYDYLSQKKVLQEDEARRLFRQIATAVYYCHIHKICHRDLKLENVLLDDTGSAKIADFGLSNVFKETSLLSTFCGSPLYASPEIVKGTPYIGPEVDCWSLGVLLYTLVYGAMPFDGSNFKRLVRQISNGDYYEPKTPSSASPLIRDMLTVDPLKRADIAYICDHPWVNTGCQISCLEMSEALAAETPVRLDLLLSLAPAARSNCNSVLLPESELGPEESGTDLTSSTSMAVEPSNSAEKRILELVAEGGEDAIKPSPTRTIVSAGDNKRKLEIAMSASGLQRKKERVASCASIAPQPAVPEENAAEPAAEDKAASSEAPCLKSSATITIQPAAAELVKDLTRDLVKESEAEPAPAAKEENEVKKPAKTRVTIKKKVPAKVEEKASPEKQEPKPEEPKANSVSTTADKLTSLSLSQPPSPPAAAPAPVPSPTPAPAPVAPSVTKPKKLSIPGGNVNNFKDQFERRASLTTPPEPKRTVTKPVLSKIAKPKAQSEDRELPSKETGSVRLQQIGIEPSPTSARGEAGAATGGVKKTESEPSHGSAAMDASALLQDARRSLQNSMAKLAEEKAGEEGRKRARDIISTYIRAGKPPVPYGRSSSAGVTSLLSPPQTPPASAGPAPVGAAPSQPSAPRVFRTEAQHRIEDHRPRGVSVERIIPIHVSESPPPQPPPPAPKTAPAPAPAPRHEHTPVRRLASSESTASEACSSPGEPIKKSAREFIIPIAVEGKGYVTPRQRSLEPDVARAQRPHKPRRISLVSGGESEEEDDTHMHRLRSTRAARAESVSSGEEDEEDEGFHLLTAENLFSTLLHRVRALTTRLNGEEGPGFPQHPHSLFNNLQSPFFHSPHLPRRHLFTHKYVESKRSVSETREGWGRDRDFDSMFSSRQPLPRGNSKKSGKHQSRAQQNVESNAESGAEGAALDLSSIQLSEAEMKALSGLTPALARRLQRQLLAHLPPSLPPAAARQLRRTLSLTEPVPAAPQTDRAEPSPAVDTPAPKSPEPKSEPVTYESPTSYCTLPRLRRPTSAPQTSPERPPGSSIRSTPERPLLSKYLSLEEPSAPESGSLLSEPSYAAAYGRRLSEASGPVHRKRISRFLRPDFFDSPPDENVYIKHKKEKELETQKILKEIREKKNKSLESSPIIKNMIDGDAPFSFKDDGVYSRKCLSPISILTTKERSRSNTPFFPSLDNIKESAIDSSLTRDTKPYKDFSELKQKSQFNESCLAPDSRLTRPKSYPVKNLDSIEEPVQSLRSERSASKEIESKENNLQRESKLIRPKSYPASSPSPEKMYVSRNIKKDQNSEKPPPSAKINTPSPEVKNDIEVSFSITLPKKKLQNVTKSNLLKSESLNKNEAESPKVLSIGDSLDLKKYKVINSETTTEQKEHKLENGTATVDVGEKNSTEVSNIKITNNTCTKGDDKMKSSEFEGSSEAPAEKKGTIKKKIIKKVSSKSKTDVACNQDTGETKPTTVKKKVTKKVKEKSSDDGTKPTVTKKKSVLQSIGHKLEKFASNKSASPEKVSDNNIVACEVKKDGGKQSRSARENSVPLGAEPPAAPGLARALTLTDVATLENQNTNVGKTTVSKVLGLFKKFEPKEKTSKPVVEKSNSENLESSTDNSKKKENATEEDNTESLIDKPRRPTSLLLNGLGRKKYGKTTSDSVVMAAAADDEMTSNKKENEPKNLKNTLKLDFSRLPRVKKIVPTNPVIEPQYINNSLDEKETEKKKSEKNGIVLDGNTVVNNSDTISRSRSRSRSTISNSENKSDLSVDYKAHDTNPTSPSENFVHHPLRNHESLSPEKEDIVDRIRRKSFYSRFNEKKQRRKSNIVGPGAAEYDPLARIHSPPAEAKFDSSPTSPVTSYDLSPGYSIASDLSPSTERYRSLLTDLPVNTRSHLRFDNYGLNDKIDTYRSLDRSSLRKYPSGRGFLEPEPHAQRYSRTKSLLDSCDAEEPPLALRDPHKYNRTISMYSPGNYATYRPKRTRNSAIILKESEKEPSPENILDKIRQRKKISISVTRKPDFEKDAPSRSTISPKGESDGAECSEKID